MIELDTDNVYTIDQADEIIEDAIKQGTVQSPQKIKYYKMICAFDIETSSFTDDDTEDQYKDIYLFYYLKGKTIRISDCTPIKHPLITFSNKKGEFIDEFYDELKSTFPGVFDDTYDPYTQMLNIIRALEDNQPAEDKDKHGLIYCWQFAINGRVIFGRYIIEFIHLLDKLEKYTSKDCKILVYVHNLAFEFQWIRCYIKWSKVFAVAPRKPIYARTEGGIEFRCSYVLTNYSLADLSDQLHHYHIKKLVGALDYDKIRTPQTPLTPMEVKYAVHDVLVISAYIQECIIKERFIFNIPLTATGYCRRYTRNKCLYLKGFKANTSYRALMNRLTLEADEYNSLKDAFQGGFTHCSFRFSGRTMHQVHSLDFTSSYPYALLSEQYPMSKAEFIGNIDPYSKEFDTFINYYACLFEIELYGIESLPVPDHYISLSKCSEISKYVVDNGRIAKADFLKMTITELDYKIIMKTYKIDLIRVSNLRIYKKNYLPRELIMSIIHLYQQKTTLKGVQGREQDYLNGKALLNSVYGMMVTDISKDMNTYSDNEWNTEPADVNKNIERYNKSKKRFLFYPWGVWCTAYARYNLWGGILSFGDDYIYSDTDSLKVLNLDAHWEYINNYNSMCEKKLRLMCKRRNINYNELEPLTIKGEKKPLGVWDWETKGDPYIEFKSLRAKNYLTHQKIGGYHLTVSGVNKYIAMPYLLDKYGDKVFDAFDDALNIPADYTGKLTHCYIDRYDRGKVVDYLGHEYEYRTPTAIYLEKGEYNFDISGEYKNYLKGVFITK